MKVKISMTLKETGSNKKTKQIVLITDGRTITRFTDSNQAKVTYEKMKEDKKKVLFSRGMIIQYFKGLNTDEIKKIIYADIPKSIEYTDRIKKRIEVEDIKEEIVK